MELLLGAATPGSIKDSLGVKQKVLSPLVF